MNGALDAGTDTASALVIPLALAVRTSFTSMASHAATSSSNDVLSFGRIMLLITSRATFSTRSCDSCNVGGGNYMSKCVDGCTALNWYWQFRFRYDYLGLCVRRLLLRRLVFGVQNRRGI